MTEKEELQKLVKESTSLTDILRKQGKATSGAAMKILKEKLDEYGIPYFFMRKKQPPKMQPLSEILKENRPYPSNSLKQRLFKEGLKENKCEICGQGPEWNGKLLILQLDHINGNHDDNRLENLRIVCPNCHTQTDTFGNKRMKKVNHCIDCGAVIGLYSKRCLHCAAQANVRYKVPLEERPSKDELLDMIKKKSFAEIAKMYGVEESAIRKWCKKMGLPHNKAQVKELIDSENEDI